MKSYWLGALSLVALLSTAPLASAQVSATPTATTVDAEPFADPLEEGKILVTTAEVAYTYTAPAVTMAPTQVHLEIVDAPSWVSAVVSPSTLTFAIQAVPYGLEGTNTARDTVSLAIAPNGTIPEDVTGTITLRAVAQPNNHLGASSGEASIIIVSKASTPVVCDGTDKTTASDDGGLTTQTLGASAAPSLVPVAAAGVVGAVAGLGVARWKGRREG